MIHLPLLQQSVDQWIKSTFGPEENPRRIRNLRLLEEAVELVLANGLSPEDVRTVVEEQITKPLGEVEQEVGGVMLTLVALCNERRIDLEQATIREHTRAWRDQDAIREKNRSKLR